MTYQTIRGRQVRFDGSALAIRASEAAAPLAILEVEDWMAGTHPGLERATDWLRVGDEVVSTWRRPIGRPRKGALREDRVRVPIDLPVSLRDEVTETAAARGVSRQQAVEDALRAWLG